MYFNATSLKNKIPEFQVLLQSNKYGVICVSETWLNDTIPNSLLTENLYSCVRKDRVNRVGGVCFCVRTDLRYTCVSFDRKFDSLETIAIDVFLGSIKYRLCCVYRPPCSSFEPAAGALVYTQLLSEWMFANSQCCFPVIFVGDFNLPNMGWSLLRGAGPVHEEFLQCVLENGLSQFITEPTFGDNTLDLLLCTDANTVCSVDVKCGFSTSNHSSLSFELLSNIESHAEVGTYVDYKSGDYTRLEAMLSNVDWPNEFSSCITVADFWGKFSNILQEGIDLCIPRKKISRKRRAYCTPRMRRLKTKKKRLYRVYCANRSEETCNMYKKCSRDYKSAAREAQQVHERKILGDGDVRSFYKFVNRKLSSRDRIPVLKKPDGSHVVSDKEKSEVFNKFFASVYCDDDGRVPKFRSRVEGDVGMSNVVFDVDSVRLAMKNLPGKLSGTPDGFPSLLFKKLSAVLSAPLASIFEVSFHTSSLPPQWLTADICPVFKKGVSSNCKNYRPISLTCIACKIMETVIKANLLSYLLTKKLITVNNTAFSLKSPLALSCLKVATTGPEH